ncbi:hypothetical protein [Archangium sp.]|uniref:hypothetical protein n=1 Tax=Archangium sp. TaxID=1872627 RepID=UPI002D55652D|nr:hypothetical protein [Archangium sp.]HYO59236.1 hypothetical protein [Archangium sp.]
MSKRIATAVAIIGAAGAISGCAFEQPSPGCQVQDSDVPWQAVYILKNPEADGSKSCSKLKGEAIGAWKYVKDPLTNPTNQLVIRPEGTASRFVYTYEVQAKNEDGTPKVKDGKPVMEEVEAERADPNEIKGQTADGRPLTAKEAASSGTASLAMEPDSNGLCAAQGFDRQASVIATEVRHQETNEVLVPAETAIYTYKNVQVYSAAGAPGTQLSGEFTYSDGPGCEVEYKMLALWPQTACDPEAFANPTEENAADRCAEGSGLNPDFDAVCVAGIGPLDDDGARMGGCVPNPAKGVPSFK